MKVVVGEVLYESTDEPILLVLTPEEKELIKTMPEDHKRFCVYPENMEEKEVNEWLRGK